MQVYKLVSKKSVQLVVDEIFSNVGLNDTDNEDYLVNIVDREENDLSKKDHYDVNLESISGHGCSLLKHFGWRPKVDN